MKKTLQVIAVVVVIFSSGVLLLEAASRFCPKIRASELYPRKSCVEIVTEYTPDLESKLLHEKLTIDEVLESRTLYVSQEGLGANGTSCFAYAILVNKELPPRARRYVAIHEAVHFLGELDETKANFRAAAREPIGLVQTVFYTLGHNVKLMMKKPLTSYPCVLSRLWIIFKVYFLGDNFERFVDTGS